MTTQEVLDAISGLSLPDLQKVQQAVFFAVEKQKKALIRSVSAEKTKHGVILKHATNGTYICKPAAYHGRWRMWKMVTGQRGLKQGPVVVHESSGVSSDDDLYWLKIQIALGHYKDVAS